MSDQLWHVVIMRKGRTFKDRMHEHRGVKLHELAELIGDPRRVDYVQLGPEGALFTQWRKDSKRK